MSLTDVERDIARVCLATEPPAESLERLGDRRRWLLYREMVRGRLIDMVGSGLPRTREALGVDFRRWADLWLAEHPPRTPFIRDVVGAFVDFVVPRWSGDAAVPGFAVDLATYERAIWEVGYATTNVEGPVVEFVFDRVPVVTAAHRLLRLTHAVYEPDAAGAYAAGEFRVLVYRHDDSIGYWVLNDLASAIFAAWVAGGPTAAEAVQRITAERGLARDERFFEGLATIVAGLLERGVLLGSR